MKIVTTLITEFLSPGVVAILDGPSTANHAELRRTFRETYRFPSLPVAIPSGATNADIEELRRDFNARMRDAYTSAMIDLGGPDGMTEADLFVRWLKRYHGFTDHPFTTFHYDDEED